MVGIRGVFSAAELQARGMTAGALQHALVAGRQVRVRRGIYCTEKLWRMTVDLPADRHAIESYAAWLALGRRGWATGYSAALLADLPVPHGQPQLVNFALPQRAHGRRRYPGLRLRTASLGEGEVQIHRGVPVTSPARTALDIAREHGFAAGLVAADAALRQGTVGAQLREAVDRMAQWPAGRQAILVADHANGAREAPSESISYAAFVAAGLPLPTCNAWLTEPGTGGIRADFVWPRHRLVGEVDGNVKYLDPRWAAGGDVLVNEKKRQLRIEEAGFTVVRWAAAEAMYQPDVVINRLERQSKLVADLLGVPCLARQA